MCTQNENGQYPSCLEAQFGGPGAEEHGLCCQCANILHADKELFEKRWNDEVETRERMELQLGAWRSAGEAGEFLLKAYGTGDLSLWERKILRKRIDEARATEPHESGKR